MTDIVRKKAPEILEAIKKSNNILMHCHPSPDPDSLGSTLAMKEALSQMGKKSTVIMGDSKASSALQTLPGFDQILQKKYSEINPEDFDLFIILDSSDMDRVSSEEVKIPASMTTVVIDHHTSNHGFGQINLVDQTAPAACQIVFELFSLWDINITHDMAINLMLGIYTDSLFKYSNTNPDTFLAAAALAKIAPDFPKAIFEYENNSEKQKLYYEALALSNIKEYFNHRVAISSITNEQLTAKGIRKEQTQSSEVSSALRQIKGWDLVATAVEFEPAIVSFSFRTRDTDQFDLSKIAVALGGGGHQAAAGARVSGTLNEAIKMLLNKLPEVYPQLLS